MWSFMHYELFFINMNAYKCTTCQNDEYSFSLFDNIYILVLIMLTTIMLIKIAKSKKE